MDGIKLTQAPATLKRLGHQLEGTLHLMKHHMVFKAQNREIWICYPIISELAKSQCSLRVVCKDFMFVSFEFKTERECCLALETIEELRQVRCIDQLYAFVYSPATLEKHFNGWTIYDAEREYVRMGAIAPNSSGSGNVDSQLASKDAQSPSKDSTLTSKDSQLVSKDSQLVSKDSQLVSKDSQLVSKDSQLVSKDSQLVSKDSQLASKDSQVSSKDSQLVSKDSQLVSKDSQLVSKDSQSPSNSQLPSKDAQSPSQDTQSPSSSQLPSQDSQFVSSSGSETSSFHRASVDSVRSLDGESKWRLSLANADHKLCSTYPRELVVPSNISDNVLFYAAKFRSKGRLPVLSYYLKLNQCTISRCSQPLVGLKQARNMQDEAVIAAIWQTTEGPRDKHGAQTDHLVVDLRPGTNAIAQVALGGGSENMDRYKPARKLYMGVDNLHVMRDSLSKVTDSLRHSDVGDEPPNPNALDRSQWLKHIALLVESSRTVVEQVYYKCSHVVVHCSDGWDRTPQITSLAMLCLDPYYRTLEGFMVLVEKEWVSFGHQFALRANIVNSKSMPHADSETEETDIFTNVTNFLTETAKGSQSGPIFQQFLDCVYQLTEIWPEAFEFNERFLRRLVYHAYAGQYGTFLFNSNRELLSNEAPLRTRSVWDYFLARKPQFVNPQYKLSTRSDEQVLVVPADWKPRWWAGAFGRIDSDMNDPNAWRRRPPTRKAQRPEHISAPKHYQKDRPSIASASLSASALLTSASQLLSSSSSTPSPSNTSPSLSSSPSPLSGSASTFEESNEAKATSVTTATAATTADGHANSEDIKRKSAATVNSESTESEFGSRPPPIQGLAVS